MPHSHLPWEPKGEQDLTLPPSSPRKEDSSGPMLSDGMAGVICIRNKQKINAKLSRSFMIWLSLAIWPPRLLLLLMARRAGKGEDEYSKRGLARG